MSGMIMSMIFSMSVSTFGWVHVYVWLAVYGWLAVHVCIGYGSIAFTDSMIQRRKKNFIRDSILSFSVDRQSRCCDLTRPSKYSWSCSQVR